jgi:hypothetical protein
MHNKSSIICTQQEKPKQIVIEMKQEDVRIPSWYTEACEIA